MHLWMVGLAEQTLVWATTPPPPLLLSLESLSEGYKANGGPVIMCTLRVLLQKNTLPHISHRWIIVDQFPLRAVNGYSFFHCGAKYLCTNEGANPQQQSGAPEMFFNTTTCRTHSSMPLLASRTCRANSCLSNKKSSSPPLLLRRQSLSEGYKAKCRPVFILCFQKIVCLTFHIDE